MFGKIDPNRKCTVFSIAFTESAESLGFIFLLPSTTPAFKRIGLDSSVIVVDSTKVRNSDILLHNVGSWAAA